MARAAFEMAQARVSMLAAEHEMSAGSHAGSVGRRLDDVRSDTGSSGPSPLTRETVQENPFAGVFSSPTTTTIITPTPTIYDVFSATRGVHIMDEIVIPKVPHGISAPAESQPPGYGISAPAESRYGGIPRPLSAVSAPAELPHPRGMISAPAESSRPRSSSRKHDRHGNIVLSAPAGLASSITVAGVHHGQVSRQG